MIEDLGTYGISDFALFSREALTGTIEVYNRDTWPIQAVWILLSAAIVVLYRRGFTWSGRASSAILAAAWLWTGLTFHLMHFSSINWAAKYFAGLFLAEAAALLAFGVLRGTLRFVPVGRSRRTVGIGLFVLAAFVPIELLWGDTKSQVLLFGWGPSQTALGTVGILILSDIRRFRSLLLAPPILWCLAAALMHLALIGQ